MRELALFAGAGGGLLASRLLGFETVAAVEIEPFCRDVLRARQADGMLEEFPIYEDVRTFDPEPWRGKVDIVTGGFPCQDISSAGRKAGIDGRKSSLWLDMWRICREVGARLLFVENSSDLTARGLGEILGALAQERWDAEWCVLGAGHLGAPHIRERLWLLACDADSQGEPTMSLNAEAPRMPGLGAGWPSLRWPNPPALGGVPYGMANRMDRLAALGNGQVPRVAAAAFSTLSNRLMEVEHVRAG